MAEEPHVLVVVVAFLVTFGWVAGGFALFLNFVHGTTKIKGSPGTNDDFSDIEFAPHRKLRHLLFAVVCGPIVWLLGTLYVIKVTWSAAIQRIVKSSEGDNRTLTVRFIRWFLEDAESGIKKL